MKTVLISLILLGLPYTAFAVDTYPAKDFRVKTGAMLIILDKMEATYRTNNNMPNDQLRAMWNGLGSILHEYAPLPKTARGDQAKILNEFHIIYINYGAWLSGTGGRIQSAGAIDIINEHRAKARRRCSAYNIRTKGKI